MILSHGHFEFRFVAFALLMAGIAANNQTDKELALSLMKTVERNIYGGYTSTVRKLLETVYEKQQIASVQTGDASSVDWVEVMELSGQKFILC